MTVAPRQASSIESACRAPGPVGNILQAAGQAAAPAEQWSAPVAPTLATLERINADAGGSLPSGTTGGCWY